jgi:predicted enzyme related to lactoylglutathione lyase
MSVGTGTTNEAAARDAREAMVDALETGGRLTSASVLAALRAVPRERFAAAGTPLEQVYDRFIAAGGGAIKPPQPGMHPQVRFSYAADPEGNLVELISFLPGFGA